MPGSPSVFSIGRAISPCNLVESGFWDGLDWNTVGTGEVVVFLSQHSP